jgi:hypothetical protein
MTRWTGTWHPLAERFPMLTEDELRDMAASIAKHGQFVPCRMGPDGVGLDGRNRVAACALAGVEPRWEVYEDSDAVTFIVEINAERRHLSTGQRAMAVAIGLADAGKRINGRGGKREWEYGSVPKDGRTGLRTWADAVARAGLVLDHAPELADAVLSGDLALDAAHKQADERRKARERIAALGGDLAALVESGVIDVDEAERRARDEKRRASLPIDLAERVDSGALSLDEAELIDRQNQERMDAYAHSVVDALGVLSRMVGYPVPDGLNARLSDEQATALHAVLTAMEATPCP